MDLHDTHDDFHVLVCGVLSTLTASKHYTAIFLNDDEEVCRQNRWAVFQRNYQDKDVNVFDEQLLKLYNIII